MAMTRDERLARKRARYVSNREKNLEYAAKYRADNPEAVKKARKHWYKTNADYAKACSRKDYYDNQQHHLDTMRAWREANPGYHKAHALAYYRSDIEAGRTRCRAHRAKDAEKHRKRFKEWVQSNQDKMRDSQRRRRARKLGTQVEAIIERDVFDRDGWRCYICEAPVVNEVPFGTPNKAILEHVIPLARGGTHTWMNVRCACHRCNQMKGAHSTPEQVRKRLTNEMGHVFT